MAKRTIKSRPSISKSSFFCMLGRRGRDSRKPIWREDKVHLINSLWPAPVLLMVWVALQSQRSQIWQHDHFADKLSGSVDEPEGCKWHSRRKYVHPAAPVLFWPHQSESQTDPSSSSSLPESSIITEAASQLTWRKLHKSEALTLIKFWLNIGLNSKSVLGQAGFKIHLKQPKAKSWGISRKHLIKLQLCVRLTIRPMREAM